MTGLPSPPVLHADHIEQWTGVYEGTAGVFIREQGAWYRGEAMQLVMEVAWLRSTGKTLQIRWDFPHPVSRAYLGPFHVPVTMIGPTQMAGEWVYEHSLERGSKKEFSFTRDGRKVSGRIKEFRRENLGGPFLPRNEWVVELTRADGPPSTATPGT